MVLQKICPALVGAALLMAGAAVTAAEYRADEFLGLDLSKVCYHRSHSGRPGICPGSG